MTNKIVNNCKVNTFYSLEKLLKYKFNNINLLKTALTHRSIKVSNNERMEFLGDSLLSFIISKEIYKKFKDAKEGKLSKIKSSLVNKDTLLNIAIKIKLKNFIILKENEYKNNINNKKSVLSNTVEAIIAAIYLDSYNINKVKRVIMDLYKDKITSISDTLLKEINPKTTLQEFLHLKNKGLCIYTTHKIIGPPHKPLFYINLKYTGIKKDIIGTGKTKKEAESNAARQAMKIINNK